MRVALDACAAPSFASGMGAPASCSRGPVPPPPVPRPPPARRASGAPLCRWASAAVSPPAQRNVAAPAAPAGAPRAARQYDHLELLVHGIGGEYDAASRGAAPLAGPLSLQPSRNALVRDSAAPRGSRASTLSARRRCACVGRPAALRVFRFPTSHPCRFSVCLRVMIPARRTRLLPRPPAGSAAVASRGVRRHRAVARPGTRQPRCPAPGPAGRPVYAGFDCGCTADTAATDARGRAKGGPEGRWPRHASSWAQWAQWAHRVIV